MTPIISSLKIVVRTTYHNHFSIIDNSRTTIDQIVMDAKKMLYIVYRKSYKLASVNIV